MLIGSWRIKRENSNIPAVSEENRSIAYEMPNKLIIFYVVLNQSYL